VSAKTNSRPAIPAHGFTVVELLISISLIAILSVSLIGIFSNYLVIITRNNLLVDMTVDSQNLLRSTVEELRYGAGVRQTNAIADANAPSGGWNTNNTSFVIIIAVPAVDIAGNYIIDANTGSPYSNEMVYYKTGKTMYKRSLAHPDAIGNKMRNSCPVSLVTASCLSDRKLTENVKDMNFLLYDQDNTATTNTLLARSVKIDLLLERDTFGAPLTYDNTIRVTLRNRF